MCHTKSIYIADDFDNAVKFMTHLRNVEPPIYNALRLKEKPIPTISISDNLANIQPSTSSSQQTISPNEPNVSAASEESDEGSFKEPLIYESDHENTENVSKDLLELPSNQSTGSIDFLGFSDEQTGDNSVTITAGNFPIGNEVVTSSATSGNDGKNGGVVDEQRSIDEASRLHEIEVATEKNVFIHFQQTELICLEKVDHLRGIFFNYSCWFQMCLQIQNR